MKFVLLLNNRLEISLLAREGHELADMIWWAMLNAVLEISDSEVRA